MGKLGKVTDLSYERPSRRSWLPSSRPARGIGRHRHTSRRWWPDNRTTEVRVGRALDLPKLEGDPTYRADPGLLRLGAQARPLRGEIQFEIEAPAASPQGTAMTVVILLGTGAGLGACGFAACEVWHLPAILSVAAVALLFVSPLITYVRLRRRNHRER
jgi:hypothetical protein